MPSKILRSIPFDRLPKTKREPVDAETLKLAAIIIEEVRQHGDAMVRKYAQKHGDWSPERPLIYDREALAVALENLAPETRALLERTAGRIRNFAKVQKQTLTGLNTMIEGGAAGHQIAPVARAGCYAPGGRFPLVSSILMTAIPARVAGVRSVWVATPKPGPEMLAAAAIADADTVLAVGGAQAIAAFAFGTESIPACDVIVGPGNRWVTAAKKLVAGHVAIDMLAGPSELLVLADGSADPAIVAADLLAQAEHDPDALPILVSLSEPFIEKVRVEVERQLADLPTSGTAELAFHHSFAVFVPTPEHAIAICDALAPEHLEVLTRDAEALAPRLSNYGALFIGPLSAEVFGDYGAGPNHVLPTGRAARYIGGLSVFNFLRIRTWLKLTAPSETLINDSAALAELEGLDAHVRAARMRLRLK